jgi:TetR/AcrR family transcriptional regulator, fatty acid metabolism regulator protein
MKSKQEGQDRTFIEEARRAQIVQCAADVIAESGYGKATMAEIAKRAGIAKSVISYHFDDKNDLMRELVQTAVAKYAQILEPRMAAEPSAPGKIRAFLAGSGEFMTAHRNMNLAILEIGFNALDAAVRPLLASMSMDLHLAALEQILLEGQASGELREFDVHVVAELLRSAVFHTMTMAQRADPGVDLAAYARELGTVFDLATRGTGGPGSSR